MIFHCAIKFICHKHCVKSVCIRSYSGPYFPAYGPNTERYGVSLRIHSECGKIWTRITPNTDTFQVYSEKFLIHVFFSKMAAWKILLKDGCNKRSSI